MDLPRSIVSAPRRSVTLVHTSDVHIGNGVPGIGHSVWPERAIECLDQVLQLTAACKAAALLITGDLFDHNRIGPDLARDAIKVLAQAHFPVIILPGNHDPFTSDSVYRRYAFPANVRIIGSSEGELMVLPEVGIQVWGRAHTDYADFAPHACGPQWHETTVEKLWRIVLAHGLYVRSAYERNLSYRIHDHELEALQADYIGLGHLEHHESVGPVYASAHYAGAPRSDWWGYGRYVDP